MILLILAGILIGVLTVLIVWGEVQAWQLRRARTRHPSQWGRWQ